MKPIVEKQKIAIVSPGTNSDENPLRELYGAGVRAGKLITQKEFKKFRKSFEPLSKWWD